MSAKGHTYIEISEYLMQNVEGLQFVDKDKGQLEDISNFAFPRPAIFMSFGRFEYNSTGGKNKLGQGVLRFRVAVENYADSYSGSVNQEKALAFFDFNEAVHVALEGLSGTYFGKLNLVSDEDDVEHNNVIVTVLEYETILTQNSACETKSFILADPELEVLHKKNLPKQVELGSKFVI